MTLSRLLNVVLLLITSATTGALFAEKSWLLELFSHFPLQYLFISAICGLVLPGSVGAQSLCWRVSWQR